MRRHAGAIEHEIHRFIAGMGAAHGADFQPEFARLAVCSKTNVHPEAIVGEPFGEALHEFDFVAPAAFQLFAHERVAPRPMRLHQRPQVFSGSIEAELAVEDEGTHPKVIVVAKEVFARDGFVKLGARWQWVERHRFPLEKSAKFHLKPQNELPYKKLMPEPLRYNTGLRYNSGLRYGGTVSNTNPTTMPTDNRISITIPPADIASVLTKLGEIRAILAPFAVTLTPQERQRIPSLGTERGAMVQTSTRKWPAIPTWCQTMWICRKKT